MRYFHECCKLRLTCYSSLLDMWKKYNSFYLKKHMNHTNWYGNTYFREKSILLRLGAWVIFVSYYFVWNDRWLQQPIFPRKMCSMTILYQCVKVNVEQQYGEMQFTSEIQLCFYQATIISSGEVRKRNDDYFSIPNRSVIVNVGTYEAVMWPTVVEKEKILVN